MAGLAGHLRAGEPRTRGCMTRRPTVIGGIYPYRSRSLIRVDCKRLYITAVTRISS